MLGQIFENEEIELKLVNLAKNSIIIKPGKTNVYFYK